MSALQQSQTEQAQQRAMSSEQAEYPAMATIADLIADLSQYPSHLRVYVRGYEDGVNDAVVVGEVRVLRDANTEWFYGSHAVAQPGSPAGEPGLMLGAGSSEDSRDDQPHDPK